ncbi:MAG: type II toxin-antitoxin system RelE/ParE family toxin [Ferruginibacter sp.]
MSYNIEVKAEAKEDIIEAAHYYYQKATGLDVRFIEQLEIVLNIILNNPKTYKRVYKHFRQAALQKFPFVVLYEYEEGTVYIYSVFHTSQNPGKKTKRLKK